MIPATLRRPFLMTATAAFLAAPVALAPVLPAHAQQNPGWFVPPAAQTQPAPAAQARGRRGRAAPPAPVTSAPLPQQSAPEPDSEVTEAELQQKAANLPQPPVPALPDIISSFWSNTATGDAVKVSAVGAGAALPAPLAADQTYYVVKGTGTNTLQLARSASDASSGSVISFEGAGTGTLRLTAPEIHTGQKNVITDFTVTQPSTLKLLPGGAAPPPPIMGVLGVPDVMRASSAAQAVDKVIGARKQALQAEVQRAQAGWRSAEQSLEADMTHMSRDQVVSRERALRAKVSSERHALQEKQRMIQEAAQIALGQIERTLIGIIRQVAESRGMNLVLHRSQVALNVQEYDITDAVAAQLNRALPTVQIPPADVDPATLPKDWGSQSASAAR